MQPAVLSLCFPEGLPGFEHLRQLNLRAADDIQPLLLLEESSSGIGFLLAPVKLIDPGYEVSLSPENCSVLGLDLENFNLAGRAAAPVLLALAIVAIKEGVAPTANLLAPVVVNVARGLAVQAVRGDRRYSARHAIGGTKMQEAACS